jgi:NADH:ubiquinone oxidoreductase subunit 2 (subunit N)
MFQSFLRIYQFQLKCSNLLAAFPFKWDPRTQSFKLLQNPLEKRLHSFSSILQLTYVLSVLLCHTLLDSNVESLETRIVSFTFAVVLLGCGIVKIMLMERPEKIIQVYNSLLIYESSKSKPLVLD